MRPIWSRILDVVDRHGDRPALEVDGAVLTYRDLLARAAAVGATLAETGGSTAILGHRTVDGYSSVLGTVLRGATYVPLSPGFPPPQLAERLRVAGCGSLVVDATGRPQLDAVLAEIDANLVVLLLDDVGAEDVRARHPRHTYLERADLRPAASFTPTAHPAGRDFQILFTSGSTGRPKAVRTTVQGMEAFLAFVLEAYDLSETDRCSQLFDLAWDPHGHDLWVTWSTGGCLVCPTRAQLLFPATFVTDAALTVWYGVPSTAMTMQRQRALVTGAFPELRYAMLCGEALPVELTEAVQRAAPNARVRNAYGPTEGNITCLLYEFDASRTPQEAENGVVPIGHPHRGTEVRVVDERLVEVAPGDVGELLIGGAQVAAGYLGDPEQTRLAFVSLPGSDTRWYRTGDRVRRPQGSGPIPYLGRADSQVQISGARIELQEVETRLRQAPGVADVAVVPWPVSGEIVEGLTAFVSGTDLDGRAVRRWARDALPALFVPRRVHVVAALPRTASGKTDRRALLARLRAAGQE